MSQHPKRRRLDDEVSNTPRKQPKSGPSIPIDSIPSPVSEEEIVEIKEDDESEEYSEDEEDDDTEGYVRDCPAPSELLQVTDIKDPVQLQILLGDALDFINKSTIYEGAPRSLRCVLASRPYASRHRFTVLETKITKLRNCVSDDIMESQGGMEHVCPTQIAEGLETLLHFVHDIEALARLPGPEALKHAYRLATLLKRALFGLADESRDEPDWSDLEMVVGPGCGWAANEDLDKLLANLILRRLAAGEIWDWQDDLEELETQATELEIDEKTSEEDLSAWNEYPTTGWYPRTRRVLQKQVARSALPT